MRTAIVIFVSFLTMFAVLPVSKSSAACGPADWNSSHGTTVQDIFDFMSDWFSGEADANRDRATSVQDIFDFLSMWFSGSNGPAHTLPQEGQDGMLSLGQHLGVRMYPDSDVVHFVPIDANSYTVRILNNCTGRETVSLAVATRMVSASIRDSFEVASSSGPVRGNTTVDMFAVSWGDSVFYTSGVFLQIESACDASGGPIVFAGILPIAAAAGAEQVRSFVPNGDIRLTQEECDASQDPYNSPPCNGQNLPREVECDCVRQHEYWKARCEYSIGARNCGTELAACALIGLAPACTGAGIGFTFGAWGLCLFNDYICLKGIRESYDFKAGAIDNEFTRCVRPQ